jgi:hypothetical protein
MVNMLIANFHKIIRLLRVTRPMRTRKPTNELLFAWLYGLFSQLGKLLGVLVWKNRTLNDGKLGVRQYGGRWGYRTHTSPREKQAWLSFGCGTKLTPRLRFNGLKGQR